MDKEPFQRLRLEYNCNLFSSEINNKTYVYRPLKTSEFNTLVGAIDSDAEIEDIIVQKAIVYPSDFDINKIKAGHVTALADRILAVSGFTEAEIVIDALNKAREEAAADIRFAMKAFIIATMPQYTEEMLNGMDVYELSNKVVLAEMVAKMQQDLAGIEMDQPPLFYIKPKDTGEEAYEEEGAPAPPPEPKRRASQQQSQQRRPEPKETKADRERLLKKLREANAETESVQNNTFGIKYEEAFKEFDDEQLVRMSGKPKVNDPIAEQLKQALQ